MERMAVCRSCGAEILFIKLRSGRTMPLDAKPIPYRKEAGGKERLVTAGGEVVACTTKIRDGEADGRGYRSHFATCPSAQEWRKGR